MEDFEFGPKKEVKPNRLALVALICTVIAVGAGSFFYFSLGADDSGESVPADVQAPPSLEVSTPSKFQGMLRGQKVKVLATWDEEDAEAYKDGLKKWLEHTGDNVKKIKGGGVPNYMYAEKNLNARDIARQVDLSETDLLLVRFEAETWHVFPDLGMKQAGDFAVQGYDLEAAEKFIVNAGEAYFLIVTNDTVSFGLNEADDEFNGGNPLTLTAGWNLIAFNGNADEKLEKVFKNVWQLETGKEPALKESLGDVDSSVIWAFISEGDIGELPQAQQLAVASEEERDNDKDLNVNGANDDDGEGDDAADAAGDDADNAADAAQEAAEAVANGDAEGAADAIAEATAQAGGDDGEIEVENPEILANGGDNFGRREIDSNLKNFNDDEYLIQNQLKRDLEKKVLNGDLDDVGRELPDRPTGGDCMIIDCGEDKKLRGLDEVLKKKGADVNDKIILKGGLEEAVRKGRVDVIEEVARTKDKIILTEAADVVAREGDKEMVREVIDAAMDRGDAKMVDNMVQNVVERGDKNLVEVVTDQAVKRGANNVVQKVMEEVQKADQAGNQGMMEAVNRKVQASGNKEMVEMVAGQAAGKEPVAEEQMREGEIVGKEQVARQNEAAGGQAAQQQEVAANDAKQRAVNNAGQQQGMGANGVAQQAQNLNNMKNYMGAMQQRAAAGQQYQQQAQGAAAGQEYQAAQRAQGAQQNKGMYMGKLTLNKSESEEVLIPFVQRIHLLVARIAVEKLDD